MYRRGWGEGMLDSMFDEPADTPGNKWGLGIALPLLVLIRAGKHFFGYRLLPSLFVLPHIHAVTPQDWWFGCLFLSLASGIHFHYFWTIHPKLAPYADLGKIASLIVFIAAFGVAVCGQFRPI